MIVKVTCAAGHRGGKTPHRLSFNEGSARLVEALDCWPGAGHRCFKMAAADGAIYLLRHDAARDRPELTVYREASLR